MIFLFKQVIFRFHVSFRGYKIWYLGSHPLVLSSTHAGWACVLLQQASFQLSEVGCRVSLC